MLVPGHERVPGLRSCESEECEEWLDGGGGLYEVVSGRIGV